MSDSAEKNFVLSETATDGINETAADAANEAAADGTADTAQAVPAVSIIVPVYKVPEEYLRKCAESCMGQTLHEIEILLVDDGSPDRCGEICDEYAAKDSRVRALHKENGGRGSARNAGFAAARGKWIMFVDGDDWIDADMCEQMLGPGEKEDVDLVMCGITREYGHSSQDYKFYLRDYTSGGKV